MATSREGRGRASGSFLTSNLDHRCSRAAASMPTRSQTSPASPSSHVVSPPSKQATMPAPDLPGSPSTSATSGQESSSSPSPLVIPSTPPTRPNLTSRPSPMTRASTLWHQHAPAQIQDLHFPPLPQMSLPQIQMPQFDLSNGLMGVTGFLSRFTAHQDGDVTVPAPEVVKEGYEPLGEWKEMLGFMCYVVGPDPSLVRRARAPIHH